MRDRHSESIVWATAPFQELILKSAVFARQNKLINILLFLELLSL